MSDTDSAATPDTPVTPAAEALVVAHAAPADWSDWSSAAADLPRAEAGIDLVDAGDSGDWFAGRSTAAIAPSALDASHEDPLIRLSLDEATDALRDQAMALADGGDYSPLSAPAWQASASDYGSALDHVEWQFFGLLPS